MSHDDASGSDSEPQGYWFESKRTQVRVSPPDSTLPNDRKGKIKSIDNQLASLSGINLSYPTQ